MVERLSYKEETEGSIPSRRTKGGPMFKASMIEVTLLIEHPKFNSWEDLEVKIRETLMQALELGNMDSVNVTFERHAGLEEFHGEVAER